MNLRSLWIALMLISGVIVGTAAGLLVYWTGAGVATALLSGGAAFAGTVALLITLAKFAWDKST